MEFFTNFTAFLNPALVSSFLSYFVVAILLLAVFQFIYVKVTPYDEYRLIREGNVAAAITYAGALIGFVLPLHSAITNSLSVYDMVVWGITAGLVQITTFFIYRAIFNRKEGGKRLSEVIESKNYAVATKMAAISISIGLLNAACMSY